MDEVKRMLLNSQSELFRYAMYLTGEECAAWDLLQETSMRILTRKQHYSEQGSFLGWARIIMKHTFFNIQKSRRRSSVFYVDGYSEYDECQYSVAESEIYSVTNEMLAMIDDLPPHLSRAFHLFIDGYTYADIACKMSVSVDNVRNYLHAARLLLRKMLE